MKWISGPAEDTFAKFRPNEELEKDSSLFSSIFIIESLTRSLLFLVLMLAICCFTFSLLYLPISPTSIIYLFIYLFYFFFIFVLSQESAVAAYEFTTLTCIPGTFKYKGSRIQLLDLPGIIEGAADGKGRGRQVIAVARTCNLILIVLDAAKPLTHKRVIEKELENCGIRLNQKPPNIIFKLKQKGGINITFAVSVSKLDKQGITAILKEYRINNCDLTFREDANMDQLIDVIEGNRIYTPCLYVLNKIDSITIEELDLLSQVPHYVPIAAAQEWNFDVLLEEIWSYLNMKRIYTKPKGQVHNNKQTRNTHKQKQKHTENDSSFCTHHIVLPVPNLDSHTSLFHLDFFSLNLICSRFCFCFSFCFSVPATRYGESRCRSC